MLAVIIMSLCSLLSDSRGGRYKTAKLPNYQKGNKTDTSSKCLQISTTDWNFR